MRRGRDEDVPFLAPIELAGDRLFVEAGHPEFGVGTAVLDADARRAIAEGRLTVAELDGHIVGWTMVEPHGHERRLAGIYVDPARHRAGIGTALLDRVVDDARADGVTSVVLDTQDDVPWNRPWYERRGFVVVAEAEWTDHMRAVTAAQIDEGLDWATRVHMRREL